MFYIISVNIYDMRKEQETTVENTKIFSCLVHLANGSSFYIFLHNTLMVSRVMTGKPHKNLNLKLLDFSRVLPQDFFFFSRIKILLEAQSRKHRSECPEELLYTDVLILNSESLEDLKKRLEAWKGAFESRG